MSKSGDLPEEVLRRPTGLVVLTGLDVTYNAIHNSIWDSFSNNRRPDRVPLQFKVVEGDHEYPKCRSKQRTSYEWYIPKGIVKTAWMRKHLDLVPAVVVLFFDLDWDEPMWKEKQMECASKIESVRNSLSGRNTRVAMVLIQRNAPLPPGEDVIAAERAASLCSACDLSAKSLFVLPHTDHLLGYTIRLENAFYELAQGYYHGEARRVKAHKEFLNKTTHQLLFVRHQFKIAFFNELKQDSHTAIKHYKQAYGHILDLRMHDTNMLEIKTIAGFINYKICRLSFQHNAPLDAIAQFRKHIDFFKNRVGIPELSFEHSAWMSKQFQVFGDLFDEAIKLGLTAIQTQHPGFYYQQAANHAMIRKQLCVGLCHALTSPPTPDPLENLNNLDYYGQRPWRQGHQSIDPPDALKERDGIQALQALEVAVDHSWLIIPLLSSAVAQFKKYKSPRMKRYLMVQMGEEYYHAKDYNKALVLLSRVTWDYRNERWWPLLTSILHTSLRCSYLVGNAQEYVRICLQLISKYAQCSSEQKTRIQMNLIRVMSNDPPEPEPGCSAVCIEKAKHLWKQSPHEPRVFKVEMHNIVPFVECKARFSKDVFTADQTIVLHVYLRTHCPFPMRFSKLYVLLSNQAYSSHCVVTDGGAISGSHTESESGSADLYLVPGVTKVHTFSFLPQAVDVGKNVEINYVALELGLESARCAILHWTGGGGDAVPPPVCQQMNPPRPTDDQDPSDWQFIDVNSTAKIEPRESDIDIVIEHQSPSLVNEFYLVCVHISNNEKVAITNASLSFGLREGQEATLDQTTHVSVDKAEYDGKVISRKIGITVGNLEPGEKCTKQIFLKCLHTGSREMFAKVIYDVDVLSGSQQILCSCNKQQTFTVDTALPFDIAIKLMSRKMDVIDAVHVEEPFLLVSNIKSTSPWPLDIQNSQLSLSPYIRSPDNKLVSYLESVTLRNQDGASECNCLVVPPCVQSTVPLGSYTLNWRRKHETLSLPYVSTVLQLPSISVEQVPLFVELDLPSHGFVRTCMSITYNLYNRTMYAQEVDIAMDASDAFMFSGHKQLHMRLLPNCKSQLTFNLFPLLAGNLALPVIHMNLTRYPGVAENLLQSMIPTHIFIKPKGRDFVKA